jgi:peptidoglycan-associated lipoprotein
MKNRSLFKITALIVVALVLISCAKKPSNSTELMPSDASATGADSDGSFGEAADATNNSSCNPSVGKDHYYFDFDKDVMHEDDAASLRSQIDYLVAHNTKVRVEGNTDERGSKEYNVALGYRRAKAVSHALQQGGVPSNRVKIVSFGEEKPISFGHDENSWQCNRRVDLVYGDN